MGFAWSPASLAPGMSRPRPAFPVSPPGRLCGTLTPANDPARLCLGRVAIPLICADFRARQFTAGHGAASCMQLKIAIRLRFDAAKSGLSCHRCRRGSDPFNKKLTI